MATPVGSFIIAFPVVGPQLGIPKLDPDPFGPLGNFLTYPFIIALHLRTLIKEVHAHQPDEDHDMHDSQMR